MKFYSTMALLTLNVVAIAGCSNGVTTEKLSQETFGTPVKYSAVDVNLHPLDKTVCDPFNNIPASSLNQGIRASLYYALSGTPRMYSSADYTTLAKKSDQQLFFADLNVPTRVFTSGFSTQTNDVLKDDNGAKLIEYFGVKFETILKLAGEDEEGDYELALLSDDGTTLKTISGTKESPVLTTLIDNDGDHSTRMGCAKSTIHMTRDTTLPIQLTYYQGPRYHIANILMWRKASVAGKDSACGSAGNELFFNPEKGSEPQKAYKDLIARGWKAVSKNNYYIPKDASYNPCVQGTNPVISNLVVYEKTSDRVFLRWNTDIPATSQVKVVNKATGQVILTDSDNGLRLQHEVVVVGLLPETTYTAQAVSVSGDLGKVLSQEIEFTTTD